jgi:hypothetical protein
MTDPAQAQDAGAAVREVEKLVNKRGGGDACPPGGSMAAGRAAEQAGRG